MAAVQRGWTLTYWATQYIITGEKIRCLAAFLANDVKNSAEKQKGRRYEPACDSALVQFHPLAMDFYGTLLSHFDLPCHHLISLIAVRRGTSPACELLNLYTRFANLTQNVYPAKKLKLYRK